MKKRSKTIVEQKLNFLPKCKKKKKPGKKAKIVEVYLLFIYIFFSIYFINWRNYRVELGGQIFFFCVYNL